MGLFLYKTAVIVQYTYHKKERLKSRKLIEDLFETGAGLKGFPLKVLFKVVEDPGQPLLQAGVSVGSKRFKKSVDRNRIKRLMRESYRLQKQPLYDQLCKSNIRLVLFFIYIGSEMPEYAIVFAKMNSLLARLRDHFTPQNPLP